VSRPKSGGQFKEEKILDPAIPICDAHHHLWNRPDQRYLLDEFVADASSGHNVRRSVFVEWRSHYREEGAAEMRSVGETAFAAAVGEIAVDGSIGVCAAIVGYADLTLGTAVTPVLEATLQPVEADSKASAMLQPGMRIHRF